VENYVLYIIIAKCIIYLFYHCKESRNNLNTVLTIKQVMDVLIVVVHSDKIKCSKQSIMSNCFNLL